VSASPLPVVFCFAGQGSQYYRMGAELLRSQPVFRQWMETGDTLLRPRLGFSVLEEIHGAQANPARPFDRLEASHPAIFLVQYALAKTLTAEGVRPDMLFGISLGEFTAQVVAGMVPFEAALTAVADQPALFTRHCPPGGMIGVLGSPSWHSRSAILARHSELAGINADNHFVLSALAEDLDAVEEELRRLDLPFQRLPVPFAFHSRHIAAAEQPWREAFTVQRRESPFWPVWSACLEGQTGPADPDLGWRIVRQTMNVQATIRRIEERGPALYVDLSPSGTLAALLRQQLGPQATPRLLSVMSPFGGDNDRLARTLAALRGPAP